MKLYIRASVEPDFQSLYDFSSFQNRLESSYSDNFVQPIKSSLGRRLNNKPINQLTLEDIAVLFAMRWAKYMHRSYDGDFIRWVSNEWERHEDAFRSCYDWVHTLTFPLTIYRAVTDEQELTQDISGKSGARSWTTDFNLYSASNSIFRKVEHVYSAEIDASAISNADTILNYVFYSAKPEYGRYAESEISLKERFKMSDLHNLTKVK